MVQSDSRDGFELETGGRRGSRGGSNGVIAPSLCDLGDLLLIAFLWVSERVRT
jgi:hypothetical protein